MLMETLIEKAKKYTGNTVAVASAEDEEVLEAVANAVKQGMANFLLFGNQGKINEMLTTIHPQLKNNERVEIIDTPSSEIACELAVRSIQEQKASVLMKGNVPTATILKAVLNKEYGLRTGNVLSHVAVFEVPNFENYILVTDAAMNIAPDLKEKAQILGNAVTIAKSVGIDMPKVAPIAAVEVVNPAMQATLDAAALTVMNKRGQIKGCIVDGPLALDNAVSVLSAEHKGIKSDVAGRADILLVPTIEVGNVLYKSLVYFTEAKVGAVIAGAKAPIVLTSRSDSAESKLYSLALAVCCATE